ncbi:glycoside hydrolase family 19 protein [Pseudoalteromonas neustonica]|uniref:glycoside hydrolase family 19 protein n=1 Tax=Pseudoalteromonas neustonica TaxID=1840331 RepID=UPI0007DAFCA1|nr:glycoside hydrolase family 19 protein [Pseudoalteromonas neustonica]
MQSLLIEKNLIQIMPDAKAEHIALFIPALQSQVTKFDINSALRLAHFIAQVAHESGCFRYRVENLNYSARALRAVFGKYFTSDEMALQYARKQEAIANIVYANKMGNGDERSGDGWHYKGRGLIHLTGKDSYAGCADYLDIDIVSEPEQLQRDPQIMVGSACYLWQVLKLNELADKDDLNSITCKINGGYHGLESRGDFLERAKQCFEID